MSAPNKNYDPKPAASLAADEVARVLAEALAAVAAAGTLDELKAARKSAGREGESKRDELLPVLVETSYLVDGDVRTDRAIYDIAYVVKGGVFGSDVDLRGLAFKERGKAGQARIDALWQSRMPVAAVAKPTGS